MKEENHDSELNREEDMKSKVGAMEKGSFPLTRLCNIICDLRTFDFQRKYRGNVAFLIFGGQQA